MQCLTGMAIGLVMYKTRSFKWLGVAGAAIRLIGYGVMIHLRINESSIAELFIVQVVQGLGSGIIETIIIVAAHIVVPHAELAQVTSLISLSACLGDGIGSAIAGGIYTDTVHECLRFRLNTSNQTEIDSIFNSITGTLPPCGTPERTAVNEAVSNSNPEIFFSELGSDDVLTWAHQNSTQTSWGEILLCSEMLLGLRSHYSNIFQKVHDNCCSGNVCTGLDGIFLHAKQQAWVWFHSSRLHLLSTRSPTDDSILQGRPEFVRSNTISGTPRDYTANRNTNERARRVEYTAKYFELMTTSI